MQEKSKKLVVGVLVFSSVLLVLVGISFSYLAGIKPIDRSQRLSEVSAATSGQLKLVYSDCEGNENDDCKSIRKDLEPGESVTKIFQIKNDSAYDLKYTLYFQNLINTFVKDELEYRVESLDTGEEIVPLNPVPYRNTLDINVPIKEDIYIAKNETQRFKLTVAFRNTDYDQSANDEAEYYMTIDFAKDTIEKVPYLGMYSRATEPNFLESTRTDEGLYAMQDDYGTSYYFRGNVKNNYLKFAGFYWRIIRVNGDGTLRIIYDGTIAHDNQDKSDDRLVNSNIVWNDLMSDAKYAGYMFNASNNVSSYEEAVKNENNSTIKTVLDAWYKVNIEDAGYGNYVADEIFCNDRSVSTGIGYGTDASYFGGYKRLRANSKPSFVCPSKNDAFTVGDVTKGNGALTYPVGLITGDELLAAGLGAYDTGSTRNYLYKGFWYWSMTPDSFDNNMGYTFYVDGGDIAKLRAEANTSKGGVVPVINLTKEYASSLKGTGTIEDPYTI